MRRSFSVFIKSFTQILIVGVFSVVLSTAAVSANTTGHSTSKSHSIESGAWGDFLAGYHAETIGKNVQAMDFYNQAVEKDLPATAGLWSRIYILGLTEGRMSVALHALNRAEAANEHPPFANLMHAIQAFKAGKFAKVETLMANNKNGVTRLLGPVLIAWSRVGRKDFKGAMQALKAKNDASSQGGASQDGPLRQLHGALILELAGKPKEAGKRFSLLRKKAGVSLRTAELMGRFFERQNRPKKALALYNIYAGTGGGDILIEQARARLKSKTKPPLDIDTAQKGAAEALYNIASVLLSQGAWESTLALAHMADTLRPGFPYTTLIIAEAMERTSRGADVSANTLYKTIPLSSPVSWTARRHLAANLDRLGKTDRSVKLLETLAQERPTFTQPLVDLGNTLRRHKRYSEAVNAYTRAIARITKPNEDQWLIYYSRGIAYERTHKWPKAEADFLKALSLKADQPMVLNYLGYSWIDQGVHLKRALSMIRKAVELRPRDGYIVDSLGWGLYRTGDYVGAVKHLVRAATLLPTDSVVNSHLGDAFWRVGRLREARFQWQRAMAMGPDAKLSKILKKKLKSGLPAPKL